MKNGKSDLWMSRFEKRIRFGELKHADLALRYFILIVNANSEVFYASRTVEQFIGFHQVNK